MQPENKSQTVLSPATLPPATHMGTVTLKVADLQRSLSFYTGMIGLRILQQEDKIAVLGAGQPMLILEEVPGARRPSPHNTGLYHAAILFPDRRSLAIKIAQLSAGGVRLGQSDHLVSEAFYLSDPDGNGLELYRDRPRDEWQWDGEQVRMAIDPIDFDRFFAGITESEAASAAPAAPDGTRLGHIHLRVADIPQAEQFYAGGLGFDVTARMPGALFLSAGGYHHHLGLNTWESRGGSPAPEPSTGLGEYSIVLPNQADLDSLLSRFAASGIAVDSSQASPSVLDPFQNRIRFQVAG